MALQHFDALKNFWKQKENVDPSTEDPDTATPKEAKDDAEHPNVCASPLRRRSRNAGVASSKDCHRPAKKEVSFSIDNQHEEFTEATPARDDHQKDDNGCLSTSASSRGASARDARGKLPKPCLRAQNGSPMVQKQFTQPKAQGSVCKNVRKGGPIRCRAMSYVSSRVCAILAASLIGIFTIPRWIIEPGTHSIFGFAFLDGVFLVPTTEDYNGMDPRHVLSNERWSTVATVAEVKSRTVNAEDAKKRPVSEPQREKDWVTATPLTIGEPSTVTAEDAQERLVSEPQREKDLGTTVADTMLIEGREQDTPSDQILALPHMGANAMGECRDLISSQHRRMQQLENDNKVQAEAYQQMLKSMTHWIEYTRKQHTLDSSQSLKECMDTGLTTATLMQMQFDALSAEVRTRRKQLTDEIYALSLKVLALESSVPVE